MSHPQVKRVPPVYRGITLVQMISSEGRGGRELKVDILDGLIESGSESAAQCLQVEVT